MSPTACILDIEGMCVTRSRRGWFGRKKTLARIDRDAVSRIEVVITDDVVVDSIWIVLGGEGAELAACEDDVGFDGFCDWIEAHFPQAESGWRDSVIRRAIEGPLTPARWTIWSAGAG